MTIKIKIILSLLLAAFCFPAGAQFKAGADALHYFPQFVTGPFSTSDTWFVLNQGGANGYNLHGSNVLRLLNAITPPNFQYATTPDLNNASNHLFGLIGPGMVQTNISHIAVTNAPWQWGTDNGTNWSGIPTNVLGDFILLTNVVARTNVILTRLTNYQQTLYIDYAWLDGDYTSFWTNYQGLSNEWFTFTATSNTTLHLEQVSVWQNEAGGGFGSDSHAYLWGTWTESPGVPVVYDFTGAGSIKHPDDVNTTDLGNSTLAATETGGFEGATATVSFMRSRKIVSLLPGSTIRLYQGWELSREFGNTGATNHFNGSVWVDTSQVYLTWANP